MGGLFRCCLLLDLCLFAKLLRTGLVLSLSLSLAVIRFRI